MNVMCEKCGRIFSVEGTGTVCALTICSACSRKEHIMINEVIYTALKNEQNEK